MQYAWSYSALNNYETCPKKHYHYAIAKDVKEPANESMNWGFQVHSALANRINKQRPLPPTMTKYEPWVEWACRNTNPHAVVFEAERKLAITARFEPCEYFDKQRAVWLRTVTDVLKINGEAARVIDWKTGKRKTIRDPVTGREKDDPEQLQLCASAVFIHFPQVQVVACNFAWLAEDQDPTNPKEVEPEIFTRKDLRPFWLKLLPRINALQYSIANNEFPPKPSGLCKRHCAVVSCPYHGVGAF